MTRKVQSVIVLIEVVLAETLLDGSRRGPVRAAVFSAQVDQAPGGRKRPSTAGPKV